MKDKNGLGSKAEDNIQKQKTTGSNRTLRGDGSIRKT